MTFQQKCTKFRDFYLVKKGFGQCPNLNDFFLRIPSLIFDPARGEEGRSLTDEASLSCRWKPYCKMYISQIAKYIYLKLQNIFVPNCKVYFFPNCNIYLSLSLIHPGGERRSLTDEARPSCRWKQKEPKNTYYSSVKLTHTHKAISVNKKEPKNTQYTTIECLPPFLAVWIDTHEKYSTAFWKEAGLLICYHAINISLGFDS